MNLEYDAFAANSKLIDTFTYLVYGNILWDIYIELFSRNITTNLPWLMTVSLVATCGFFAILHQITVTVDRRKPMNPATATTAATNHMMGDAFSGSISNCLGKRIYDESLPSLKKNTNI